VRSVDVDVQKFEVSIFVYWPAQTLAPCPQCQELCPLKDSKPRQWRHLDTMQFKTFLNCDVPRTDCAEHGVLQIFLPWSDPKSRFSLMFEKMAAEIILACKNQTRAAELLRISWKQVHQIQHRSVEKALSLRKNEVIPILGIDEKSFLKGHKYVSVLSDSKQKRVLDVAEGRNEAAALLLLSSLSEKQKEGVKAVAMDMWDAFKSAVEKVLPSADIVHDRFHVTKYLNKSVDQVRKSEHREFLKQGIQVLKGTKYLWLTREANWSRDQFARYRSIKDICVKVGKAFSIKEGFRTFWSYSNQKSAETYFKKWYFWATHSRLKPVIEAARTIKRHIGNILTYFKYKITNSTAEGLNAKIQLLKSEARGYRNFENFRIAILFHCGGFKFFPHV